MMVRQGKMPRTDRRTYHAIKELDEATEEIRKSIGINHTIATYRAYVNAHLNLSRFIRDKYGKSDIPFSALEYSFIENYDMYLKIEHKMTAGSVMQHIIFLKKLVKRAMNKGVISRNPFFGKADANLIKFEIGGKGFRVKTRYQIMTPNDNPNQYPSLHPNQHPNLDPYNIKIKTKTKNNINGGKNGFSKRAYVSSGDAG
ncbi:phage integrase SAM-like domain-containing protein [Bacteroides helcogenes]|uniref:Phage integrase SAM-like domain-containing protein n=1 Tax=Bacteroides helcogenes (strain ATCC 35417 / DSM 20613 / JCM 6297 / CCUG 15421 / P 36-108) TaxID=693979 RepID=E6SSA9_BACT6|nr:phage integrase SAM-like domain-containing protein [Bacteroides helcogenes]ADV45160.1 hypothetical protein Bache_3236 [Bacteroides helcogenes P 36-108]MDY5238719.1 phage integrase SAM-like domain-containing protein [Bacteroides helcogenes]